MSNAMLLAANPPSAFEFQWWMVIPVLLAAVAFSIFLLVVNRYKRCRSDQVLVIFGKVGGGNTSKCIHGGAAFIWPLIQDYAYLSLSKSAKVF